MMKKNEKNLKSFFNKKKMPAYADGTELRTVASSPLINRDPKHLKKEGRPLKEEFAGMIHYIVDALTAILALQHGFDTTKFKKGEPHVLTAGGSQLTRQQLTTAKRALKSQLLRLITLFNQPQKRKKDGSYREKKQQPPLLFAKNVTDFGFVTDGTEKTKTMEQLYSKFLNPNFKNTRTRIVNGKEVDGTGYMVQGDLQDLLDREFNYVTAEGDFTEDVRAFYANSSNFKPEDAQRKKQISNLIGKTTYGQALKELSSFDGRILESKQVMSLLTLFYVPTKVRQPRVRGRGRRGSE